jgi:hypothetical protein
MQEIAAEPALQSRFQTAGARAISSTPEEALAYAEKERRMWQEMVKVSGAKVE